MRLLPIAVLLFILSSCALHPWGDALQEKELDTITPSIAALGTKNLQCKKSIGADAIIEVSTALGEKLFDGYIEISTGPAFKFVSVNPFGQPLLAVAINGEQFRVINTMDQKFLAGSIRSYGLRNSLPTELFDIPFDQLLMARFGFETETIVSIHKDSKAKGFWVVTNQKSRTKSVLSKPLRLRSLVDINRMIILETIIENIEGEKLSHVIYNHSTFLNGCQQPTDIEFLQTYFGVDLHVQLSNINISDKIITPQLNPPKNYLREFYP